jgi:hypothetical protein
MKRQALSWRRSSYSKLHHPGMSEKCPNAKGSLKTQLRWVQGNTLWGEHSSEQAHAACCKSSEDQVWHGNGVQIGLTAGRDYLEPAMMRPVPIPMSTTFAGEILPVSPASPIPVTASMKSGPIVARIAFT